MAQKQYDAVEIDGWDLEILAKYIYAKKRDVSLNGLVEEQIKRLG